MKKIIITGASDGLGKAIAKELKDQGININPWYCEMEIYDKLKYFSK